MAREETCYQSEEWNDSARATRLDQMIGNHEEPADADHETTAIDWLDSGLSGITFQPPNNATQEGAVVKEFNSSRGFQAHAEVKSAGERTDEHEQAH